MASQAGNDPKVPPGEPKKSAEGGSQNIKHPMSLPRGPPPTKTDSESLSADSISKGTGTSSADDQMQAINVPGEPGNEMSEQDKQAIWSQVFHNDRFRWHVDMIENAQASGVKRVPIRDFRKLRQEMLDIPSRTMEVISASYQTASLTSGQLSKTTESPFYDELINAANKGNHKSVSLADFIRLQDEMTEVPFKVLKLLASPADPASEVPTIGESQDAEMGRLTEELTKAREEVADKTNELNMTVAELEGRYNDWDDLERQLEEEKTRADVLEQKLRSTEQLYDAMKLQHAAEVSKLQLEMANEPRPQAKKGKGEASGNTKDDAHASNQTAEGKHDNDNQVKSLRENLRATKKHYDFLVSQWSRLYAGTKRELDKCKSMYRETIKVIYHCDKCRPFMDAQRENTFLLAEDYFKAIQQPVQKPADRPVIPRTKMPAIPVSRQELPGSSAILHDLATVRRGSLSKPLHNQEESAALRAWFAVEMEEVKNAGFAAGMEAAGMDPGRVAELVRDPDPDLLQELGDVREELALCQGRYRKAREDLAILQAEHEECRKTPANVPGYTAEENTAFAAELEAAGMDAGLVAEIMQETDSAIFKELGNARQELANCQRKYKKTREDLAKLQLRFDFHIEDTLSNSRRLIQNHQQAMDTMRDNDDRIIAGLKKDIEDSWVREHNATIGKGKEVQVQGTKPLGAGPTHDVGRGLGRPPGTTPAPPGTTAAPSGTTAVPSGTRRARFGTTAPVSGMTAPIRNTPGTTALRPGTTALHPGTTAIHPGTTALRPGTTALRPRTTARRPGTTLLPPGTIVPGETAHPLAAPSSDPVNPRVADRIYGPAETETPQVSGFSNTRAMVMLCISVAVFGMILVSGVQLSHRFRGAYGYTYHGGFDGLQQVMIFSNWSQFFWFVSSVSVACVCVYRLFENTYIE